MAWNRFPCEADYWTWTSRGAIGIVGKERIYQWQIDSDSLSFVANRSSRLRNAHVSGYQVDRCQNWHLLQAVTSDPVTGRRAGVVQVYSSAHSHSTVLEAEASSISAFRFPANSYTSQVLIVVCRATANSAKISVVELGPQRPERNLLVSRCESFFWKDPEDTADSVVCSPDSSLLYVLSSKGLLFVFGMDTCSAFVLNQKVCCGGVLGAVLDARTSGMLVATSAGQMLSIVAQVNQPLKRNGDGDGDDDSTDAGPDVSAQRREQVTRL